MCRCKYQALNGVLFIIAIVAIGCQQGSVIEAREGWGALAPNKTKRALASGLSREQGSVIVSCEGEDSNLHGSYPASTSS